MASEPLNIPPALKPIAHYVKIAYQNESRDPVVHYWCLYYAVQTGMKVDKSPPSLQYLSSLLSILENVKKANPSSEAITQDIVAQAHLEDFAMKLFEYADKNDRQSNFSKNVVKAFYTAGYIMDVLSLFGNLDENIVASRRYAKWKATYIHDCLKKGEKPLPGPAGGSDLDAELEALDVQDPGAHNISTQLGRIPPPTSIQPMLPHNDETLSDGGSSLVDRGPEPPLSGTSAASLPSNKSVTQSCAGPSAAVAAPENKLSPERILEAQKYAKFAVSALTYEDTKTAIENLNKSLAILTTQ